MTSSTTPTGKEWWALHFARLTLGLMAVLPLSWARGLGRCFGGLYYHRGGRARRVAERNIALAYPELNTETRRQRVRATLVESGALAAEMGHVWVRPWPYTRRLIREVEGLEHLESALTSGKGVIVLGPHLGNWEVLGLDLATRGDLVALFEPPRLASLGQLIQSARERSGGHLVPTTPRGLATLVRHVRDGGVSGILPDQVPDDPSAGLNVPFMGVDCFTAALGCNLLARSGAVALMGAAMRIPGGFRVRYVKPDATIYSDDLALALTTMNHEVERLVEGWENQYQWQYKRFRTRPQVGPDHYAGVGRRR